MATQGRVLIAAATDAGDSNPFRLSASQLPANLVFDTLGAGESVDLEVLLPDGTWAQAQDSDGNALTQEGTGSNNLAFNIPGVFRVHKDATVSAVGVNLSTGGVPGDDAA